MNTDDDIHRDRLRRMGEAEEASESISVGGLEAELSVLVSREDSKTRSAKSRGR